MKNRVETSNFIKKACCHCFVFRLWCWCGLYKNKLKFTQLYSAQQIKVCTASLHKGNLKFTAMHLGGLGVQRGTVQRLDDALLSQASETDKHTSFLVLRNKGMLPDLEMGGNLK